jgi:hypothetical protein
MKTEEEKKGYQGWSNYETWAVKLWIDNDESTVTYWSERAKELKKEGDEHLSLLLADELKEDHEEAMDEAGLAEKGLFTDLLYSALGEVEWYEIAKSILEEVNE